MPTTRPCSVAPPRASTDTSIQPVEMPVEMFAPVGPAFTRPLSEFGTGSSSPSNTTNWA
jgi:hypothetical protein